MLLTKLEEKLESLLKPVVEGLGYELYDVIYAKEAKDFYLKVFIDKETGISIDDCEKVSNAVSDLLDKEDPIKEQYFLEVSSAGLERVLRSDKHLKDNLEMEVEVKLFRNYENKKVYEGILTSFDEDTVTILEEDKNINLDRKNIAIIKTIYKW